MKVGLGPIAVPEFTRRVIERPGPGNWFMLVVPTSETAQVAERIVFGVAQEAEPGEAPEIVCPADADALTEAVLRRRNLVVTGVDHWPTSQWARLDILRSRMLQAQRVAFVVSQAAAEHLVAAAPHFARFFSGSVWQAALDDDLMDEDERRTRVAGLEAWAGLSTEEMVRRAERHELPADPEYAEWLTLVYRSDLL